MRLPAPEDEALVAFVRALPGAPPRARELAPHAIERAELHGLAGVVHDALHDNGIELPAALERTLARRDAARELEHAAHLELLGRLDRALEQAGVRAVALKGPLLAERLYARPFARPTGDIDLMVDEPDVTAAGGVVAALGYVAAEGADEDRFRREHHHLHYAHDRALPLELHFHAYRGFGRVLPSAPLIARRRPFPGSGPGTTLRAIGVLEPADELAYLAVHAAAHRFVRLGWLFDIQQLVATMDDAAIRTAAERAREWGFLRPLAFAADLLAELFGVAPQRLAAIGTLDPIRRMILKNVVSEPTGGLQRSATRFVYTTSLCDSFSAAARYARVASRARASALVRSAL